MHFDLLKLGTEVVTGASILHTLLPPWEVLNDFPKAQKYYNGRSTVYGSVSTKDGSAPSQAAVKSNGGGL